MKSGNQVGSDNDDQRDGDAVASDIDSDSGSGSDLEARRIWVGRAEHMCLVVGAYSESKYTMVTYREDTGWGTEASVGNLSAPSYLTGGIQAAKFSNLDLAFLDK
eukprot:g22145.t1